MLILPVLLVALLLILASGGLRLLALQQGGPGALPLHRLNGSTCLAQPG